VPYTPGKPRVNETHDEKEKEGYERGGEEGGRGREAPPADGQIRGAAANESCITT